MSRLQFQRSPARVMPMVEQLCLAAAVAAADGVIKHNVKEPPVKNRGFAMNRFEDHQGLVAAASAVMTAAVAVSFARASDKSRTGIALILGGAISNTYDRLVRKYVVDYIPIGHVVFNLSDFAIMAGALITAFEEMKD